MCVFSDKCKYRTKSDLFNTELSVENKRLKSIKNRNQDIPDVRMATEQVKSSLFPAKSRLCWC
jgi:hypothetical protein